MSRHEVVWHSVDCCVHVDAGMGTALAQPADQVDCSIKYWTEIELDKNVFDFENKKEITCIYTNPPFKAFIPNRKGEKQYKTLMEAESISISARYAAVAITRRSRFLHCIPHRVDCASARWR